jgi:hypothetical protein
VRGSRTETGRYVHQPIGEEVRSIGGSYTLERELRLSHADREVLVVLGHAVVDNSCCGVSGWRYAIVPGHLLGWHDQTSQEGLPVSTIEPIRDQAEQLAIKREVKGRELIQAIEFW